MTDEVNSADPVFAAEQQHLSDTYATLKSMEGALEAQMAKTRAGAEEDKKNMADEVTSNFASDAESQETYIEYANNNSVIDAYNQQQASYAEKLGRIHHLLAQPYFAKIVLEFKPGAAPRELYIGNVGLSDEDYRRLVVDWRSPVAEVYYNQANGRTSYEANGRTIEVDLKLRRQFDIDEDRLNAYFDTTIAIQDEMLLASLARQRSEKMQAITTTIQKEQNVVIRHEDVPALLVNGVAGSGKTSVLLQRIAYLFYQRRESLNPEDVYLITPNPVFRHYIDNVLPDMGERNPNILTWAELSDALIPPGRAFAREDVSLDELRTIDERIDDLDFTDKDFRDIKSHGITLISAQQVSRASKKFERIPAGPRRAELIREELEARLESRLGQMAGTEAAQEELLALTPDEQVSLLGELAVMEDDELARVYTLRYLRLRHAGAFEAVKRDYWLRVDRIGRRLLGKDDLPFLEWLYLKIACSGLRNRNAQYVMIDEVQDYTAAQLAVMARYFSRAHFLLLGDENQAIKPNTASFAEVKSVFEHTRGEVSECHLMTSYRSTPAITELFAKLASFDDDMSISSVQRDDTAPALIPCADDDAWRAALADAVAKAHEDTGLTALIVTDEEQEEKVKALLTEAGAELPIFVGETGSLPAAGTIALTLPLAKGLEFDHVIIADASADSYPEDDLARRRLYTALSRATSTVALLSRGPLTPLLD